MPGTLTMRREAIGALIVSDDELLPGSGVEAEAVGVLRTPRGGDRLVCAQPGTPRARSCATRPGTSSR